MYTQFFILLLTTLGTLTKIYADSTVDPWIVQERYDLYMSILNHTRVPELFGSDNLGNLLWGLPIQLEWQNRTGRLDTSPSPTGLRINEYSWWGNMNYYLSVIPYLSAMNKGLVPVVTILPPVIFNTSDLCVTYTTCPVKVMRKWDVYFDEIIILQANVSSMSVEDLLRIMWEAHTASINYAANKFAPNLEMLGSGEATFGNGWRHFVEVLDIIGFPTNYTLVSTLGVNLPNRMLTSTDFPPLITDMTRQMNNVAMYMVVINALNKIPVTWSAFLELLRGIRLIPGCNNLMYSQIEYFLNFPVGTMLHVLNKIGGLCLAL